MRFDVETMQKEYFELTLPYEPFPYDGMAVYLFLNDQELFIWGDYTWDYIKEIFEATAWALNFNFVSSTLTQLAHMIKARYKHGICRVVEFIYVFAGHDGDT
jgi:hypothetical protein